MEFLFGLVVHTLLVVPGALAYKLIFSSKRPLREIITDAPPYMSVLGGLVSIMIIFILYNVFSYISLAD